MQQTTVETCYLEIFLRCFANIYYAEIVYTLSNKVISPFAAKYRNITTNHQISFYHFLQQNAIIFFLKSTYLHLLIISRIFFIKKQYIHKQVSYYHFLHQNNLKNCY